MNRGAWQATVHGVAEEDIGIASIGLTLFHFIDEDPSDFLVCNPHT